MTPPPRPRSLARNSAKSPARSDPRHALGRRGEAAVAEHYRRAGYTVVARNLRTTLGELDLVVRSGSLLVAVEVKTRRDHGAPERLVDDRELERRMRALSAVAPLVAPSARRLRLRVDVAAVRWVDEAPPEIRLFPSGERRAP